jgi:hypothetical protein
LEVAMARAHRGGRSWRLRLPLHFREDSAGHSDVVKRVTPAAGNGSRGGERRLAQPLSGLD